MFCGASSVSTGGGGAGGAGCGGCADDASSAVRAAMAAASAHGIFEQAPPQKKRPRSQGGPARVHLICNKGERGGAWSGYADRQIERLEMILSKLACAVPERLTAPISTIRVEVPTAGGTPSPSTTNFTRKMVPSGAVVLTHPATPFRVNSWPGQPTAMHESGGQARTREVMSVVFATAEVDAVVEVAVAPGSQRAAFTGVWLWLHAAYCENLCSGREAEKTN